jgi:hypothetical protein
MLRRIFGPKGNEATGGRRKLHDEDQVKEDEMGGACSTNGKRGTRIGYWWENQKGRDR